MKKLLSLSLIVIPIFFLSCDADKSAYDDGMYNINTMKSLCKDYVLRVKVSYKPKDKVYKYSDFYYTKAYTAMNGYLQTYAMSFNPSLTGTALQDASSKCEEFITYAEKQLFPKIPSDILTKAKNDMKMKNLSGIKTDDQKYIQKYKINKFMVKTNKAVGIGAIITGVIEGLFKGGIAVAEYYDKKTESERNEIRKQIKSCEWSNFSDIK